LVNTAGLFNGVRRNVLLSASSHAVLRTTLDQLQGADAAAAKPPSASTVKLRAAQAAVLDLLDRLVTEPFRPGPRHHASQARMHHALSHTNRPDETFLCVPTLAGPFQTALNAYLCEAVTWPADPGQWNFQVVDGLSTHLKAFKALVNDAHKQCGNQWPPSEQYHRQLALDPSITPTAVPGVYQRATPRHWAGRKEDSGTLRLELTQLVDFRALRDAKRLSDLFTKNEVAVRENDPVANLSAAHAFAIYGGRGASWVAQSGYLDGRGNLVDSVGGARLFESAKSAETTITSRQMRGSAVVVALDVQVTGLAPGHAAAQFDRLATVISDLNRRKLMALVAQARGEDIAELRQRLAERETELANDPEAAAFTQGRPDAENDIDDAPVPRRM
jgi:hypothetical protein